MMRSKVFILAVLLMVLTAWQLGAWARGATQLCPDQTQDTLPTNPEMFDPLMPPLKIVPQDRCRKTCAQLYANDPRRQTLCTRACRRDEKKPQSAPVRGGVSGGL